MNDTLPGIISNMPRIRGDLPSMKPRTFKVLYKAYPGAATVLSWIYSADSAEEALWALACERFMDAPEAIFLEVAVLRRCKEGPDAFEECRQLSRDTWWDTLWERHEAEPVPTPLPGWDWRRP